MVLNVSRAIARLYVMFGFDGLYTFAGNALKTSLLKSNHPIAKFLSFVLKRKRGLDPSHFQDVAFFQLALAVKIFAIDFDFALA